MTADLRAGLAAEFEREAAYYAKRAAEEEAALGPGLYPQLLRDMAADRARRAREIRQQGGMA